MKIITLKEGDFIVNDKKQILLFEDQPSKSGLKLAIQPLLVIAADDYILLDSGFGSLINGKSALESLMYKKGIHTSQISKILISHLHKDHIGGIGYFKEDHFNFTFPNAEIFVQQRDLEEALKDQDHIKYDYAILAQLKSHPKLVLLQQDQGNINEYISFKISGGHTQYHQVFWIKKDGETIFYGGDDLPQKSYFERNLSFKTDYDGKKGSDIRNIWKQTAEREHWTILLYHDMKNAFLQF